MGRVKEKVIAHANSAMTDCLSRRPNGRAYIIIYHSTRSANVIHIKSTADACYYTGRNGYLTTR